MRVSLSLSIHTPPSLVLSFFFSRPTHTQLNENPSLCLIRTQGKGCLLIILKIMKQNLILHFKALTTVSFKGWLWQEKWCSQHKFLLAKLSRLAVWKFWHFQCVCCPVQWFGESIQRREEKEDPASTPTIFQIERHWLESWVADEYKICCLS